ncbi:diaminopimelate decarboxylase [Actinomycetospora sp. NBRC 106375]|uniref:diaminopimelate decarboxylase n=1 Tax=Actinomycetospora sp. NBRC 106375 TaxID=3032207 RepID=UPI0024A3140B|nr:diaminopimelate decarboxylase [Actinomycetospora sp. NBRC 106375]GLZ48065.1 diaminopimelate decarboxylase [Actinomycetospora sp. NBRC 106375]
MTRAHPAGPRHADVIAHHEDGTAPPDTAALDVLPAAVWPRHAVRRDDGVVELAGVDVGTLARDHGTPLFVVDEADFRSRCAEHAAAYGDPSLVHYAGKAFLTAEIARWVADEGLGLDVCTEGELATAVRAGFPAGRITVHGNNKSRHELAAALDAGVGAIVLDSYTEIARLDEIARERGTRAPVMVRVTVGVEAHTHEFIATAHEDQKFGFSLAAGDAAEAVRRAVKSPGLHLVGLHSHIGSQIFDADGFELAARRVIGLLAEMRDEHGDAVADALGTVDLGGGMGIAYTAADTPRSPAWLASELRAIVDRESARVGLAPPRIAVEPGRAIAGPGTVTLYEVGTVKDVELGGGLRRRYVSVDGGMSDNIRTALYDAHYDCRLVSRAASAPDVDGSSSAALRLPVRSRVVGKHCESGDVVVRDCWLPADLAPGDLVAVAATGAYCYAMASAYNKVPRPAVVAVADGTSRTLLRRETLDDLSRLEVS